MNFFKNSILKSVIGLFSLALLALPYCASAEDVRYSSLVIDANTGAVLHQENAGKLRYPASLVKMMTLYLAFQSLERGTLTMNTPLKVSMHAAAQKPSSIGLRPGQTISVQDAINAVIIKSANDASVVLAEAVGGNEPQFAAQMTRMAKTLGMNHTNFANASGLPNNNQITTAYDIARLAVALKRDYPQYYPLFARSSFTYNGHTIFSHNRVTKNYRGADGLKTGYIRASGFNLVTSAHRGDKRIVGVVMGGRSIKSRDNHMVKLLDQAFYNLSTGKLGKTAILNTSAGNSSQHIRQQPVASISRIGATSTAPKKQPDSNNGTPASALIVSNNASATQQNKEPALKIVPVSSKDPSTKSAATFSRDVAVSFEAVASAAESKTRKDTFMLNMNVASSERPAATTPETEATISEIKPKRVLVSGKTVPIPTMKPAVGEKGFVLNTNISPRQSAPKSLNLATASSQ